MSVVPISEFAQTKTKAAIKLNNQIFFLNGILSFEIAIVKFIKSISLYVELGIFGYSKNTGTVQLKIKDKGG